jgi:hypothetical protein
MDDRPPVSAGDRGTRHAVPSSDGPKPDAGNTPGIIAQTRELLTVDEALHLSGDLKRRDLDLQRDGRLTSDA